MNLYQLLRLIDVVPAYLGLVEELTAEEAGPQAVVLDAARPYLVACLQRRLKTPLLLITATPEDASFQGQHL